MLNTLIRKLSGHEPSKVAAKKRLQFALVCDKLEVNDKTLHALQNDIVEVISKYFEIDRTSLELKVERDEDTSALVFNTPIRCVRRSRV
ncbi:MAG: cell division topological specificity factor MinE [Desulfobacterium sp.]|nr:cell division topological specificity factor MinE [Desulfobacterium sp.]